MTVARSNVSQVQIYFAFSLLCHKPQPILISAIMRYVE